ncbi:MAG: hypothetical protein ACYDC3_10040 [Candidatus Binataceae bacterium]
MRTPPCCRVKRRQNGTMVLRWTAAGVIEASGLPISGVEQAKKLQGGDVASNAMIPAWNSSAGKD